uniref:Si:ch211-258f14.2 n=1 Tax=Cyprinus carpio TaxID=7962 RepID=A0A8C1IWP2_CYPCA
MARTSADGQLRQNNSKLDSFLKRNTSRDVYERIRVYEPCVVVSGSVKKVFMHVILSDERVYLSEYHPRALREALSFRHIKSIELINDLPDFLSGQDRERSLHIRVVHTTKNPGKKSSRPKGSGQSKPSFPAQGRNSSARHSLEGMSPVLLSAESSSWRISPTSMSDGGLEEEEGSVIPKRRSASCPNPDVLAVSVFDSSPAHSSSSSDQRESPSASVPTALMRRTTTEKQEEEIEEELHLYAVSPSSRIYLHLQSAWSSYIIRSTLMLDPVYRKRCGMSSSSPHKQKYHKISWERTCHLFSQLSGELLQEDVGLESLYLLLQELHTATNRNPTIKKLFWRVTCSCVTCTLHPEMNISLTKSFLFAPQSPDLYPFLVKTLAESSQSGQEGVHAADRLLLCTLVVQILSLMFRETEIEETRLSMLTAKQGALTENMLLALVRDPDLQLPDSTNGSKSSVNKLQRLQADYLDAASALLFEVVVFCQEASRTPALGHFLTIGWVFRLLKPHPFLLPFVGYQAQQVVLLLSGAQDALSPSQAVLLYQRCQVLLACLQHCTCLSKYIRTGFKEEFRYYVKTSGLEDKLPHHYPISQPAQRLLSQLLSLVLLKP